MGVGVYMLGSKVGRVPPTWHPVVLKSGGLLHKPVVTAATNPIPNQLLKQNPKSTSLSTVCH